MVIEIESVSAGQLPLAVKSWPTCSTRGRKKSHLLSLKERLYLVKT